jgi:hypothetical protein
MFTIFGLVITWHIVGALALLFLSMYLGDKFQKKSLDRKISQEDAKVYAEIAYVAGISFGSCMTWLIVLTK